MMKINRLIWLVASLALLLSACANHSSAAEANLEGTTWVLVELDGTDPLNGRLPTLQFHAGQVSGNGGCNHYNGSYHITGEAIRIDDLSHTEMACPEPAGILEQEQTYLDLFSAADRYTLEGNTLTIYNSAGQKLVFTNRPDTPVAANPTVALPTEVLPTAALSIEVPPTVALATPTPTLEISVPTPTPTPTAPPPQGFQEYQDSEAAISLYIPETWAITSVIPGKSAIFQSYPVDKYVGGEALDTGDTKCDLNIRPNGEQAADLIQQWQSDPLTEIVSTEELKLQSGLVGQRLVIDSMGRATVFVTEINQRVTLLTCFGDFTQVDAIAITLQALE